MKRHLSVKLVMLHHPIFNLCRGNKINQRLSRKCPQNYANKLLLLLKKKWFGFYLFTEKRNKYVDR